MPALAASAIAATINFPLWRASAMAHSHFTPPPLSSTSMILKLPASIAPTMNLYKHAMTGPFPGVTAVVGGMTWARASIFYGSDYMKASLQSSGYTNPLILTVAPSFLVSTFVQVANMPLIRATITQQDPSLKNPVTGKTPSTWGALNGTSAGLLKTVPKYMISIIVKDAISGYQKDKNNVILGAGGQVTSTEISYQSAFKALVAGVCGAVLTNPADVIRNEMFKSNAATFMSTIKTLLSTTEAGVTGGKGLQIKWMFRGMRQNLVAVSAPISTIIFLTDLFEEFYQDKFLQRKKTRRIQ
jgi:hypothetical protein